jgi:trans-4-hydroxy-L-proline dehydratase
VEGPLPEGAAFIWHLPECWTNGHLTPDYPALLEHGLEGLAAQARATAARLGTEEAQWFADSTTRCCEAICDYARRYAEAAEEAAGEAVLTAEPERAGRLRQAAAALRVAPAAPAPDFLAALQAIWLMHFVLSCHLGQRDYALGRMDQYLLPLYEQGLADGTLTPDLARAYLAHLFIKTKEITGLATDNYRTKPVPSLASNQYVVVGGRDVEGRDETNELSALMVEAVALAQVPQPSVNVRMSGSLPPRLREALASALPTGSAQIQFWNDDVTIPALESFGVPAQDAANYALTACNRANVPGVWDMMAGDAFHNMAHWLLTALDGGRDPLSGEVTVAGVPGPEALASLEDVLAAFAQVARAALDREVAERAHWMDGDPRQFHLESVLLQDCVARGKDLNAGGLRSRAQFHFLGGVATAADSLVALQRVVFEERRFSLSEFLEIVRADFAGHEGLRQEIMGQLPHFGNGDEAADGLARRVCELALDALAAVPSPGGHLLLPSIYSLHLHTGWGQALPATPDGRLRGEPISENQSPTHGCDREGVTALLRSVARLPLERTPTGGLNVMLAGKPDPETALQLAETFFALGGVHVGFTFVDRETLLAAQAEPGKFRSLCVRITGFSEYFVALSPEAQADVVARTEY